MRNLRVQGKAHVPNTCMELADPFPSTRALTTLLCYVNNKRQLQNLICSYLTESTCKPSNQCRTTALTLFSIDAVLLELRLQWPCCHRHHCLSSGSGPNAAAARCATYQNNVGDDLLPCLVTDEIADCIVQLHCMTGCHANAGFYGMSKTLVDDQVVKSSVARRQLLRCRDSLDLEDDVIEGIFEFTQYLIYGIADHKSSTMAEACAMKLKR